MISEPADWPARAICGEDRDLFFGPDGESRQERLGREQIAKVICYQCPVRAQCLGYAVGRGIGSGVWGGYGEDELRGLRHSYLSRKRAAQRQQGSAA